jgi:hypothetical protein
MSDEHGSSIAPLTPTGEKIQIEIVTTAKGIRYMKLDKKKYKKIEETVDEATFQIIDDE